jgi:uncharacterized Rossmann fold enzyme
VAKIQGVNISTCVPEEKIKQNIVDARSYCVTPISESSDWREGKVATIVGGGPSLSKHLDQLRKEKLIIACGSVHDYLINNAIYPTYTLVCDPDPIMAKYLYWDSLNGVTFLVASQCDKAVFEALKERKIYIWDCLGPTEFNEQIFDQERKNAIPGGCTVGTRAILCAIAMGFKKIKLYGFDSCLDEKDNHHAYEFINPEIEQLGPISEIRLDFPSDKVFKVAGYMMAQVFDFQKILEVYADTLQIEVIGDGVLAEIMRIGQVKAKELENGDSK